MTAVSSFAIIYHVWTTVRTSLTRELPPSLSWLRTLRTALLLTAPFAAFAAFGIAGAVVASRHPDDVSLARRKLYCSVDHNPLSIVVALFSAAILLLTIYYEARIMLTLRRTYNGLRGTEFEERVGVDAYLVLRVALFGVYAIVGFMCVSPRWGENGD